MTQSVLGSITLGYRPLWNRERALAGLQLYVGSEQTTPVDAPHLLRTLQELWSEAAPRLLLSVQSPGLLVDLLQHAPTGSPWIEVRGEWLADAAIAEHVRNARARGLALVWGGDSAALPSPEAAAWFERSLLTLSPQEAMAALRAAQRRADTADPQDAPLLANQICEGIASRTLLDHCLEHQSAWGVAGWPAEDVLHGYRDKPAQPSHAVILRLARAIDTDQSMELMEHILGEDPVLSYRFIQYINSAAVGVRSGIESLRHALMMLGYKTLSQWLARQLPHAATDPDLEPIRIGMVLRGQLAEHLLDAGIDDDLRREVYLCGLFSQLDQLMHEPLGVLLKRVPLSERIYDANVLHSGPYAPSLELAAALETPDGNMVRALCEKHGLDIEEVNRGLLRTLATSTPGAARG